MKFICALILSLVSIFAISSETIELHNLQPNLNCPQALLSEEFTKEKEIDIAKSGCCSWHGGVCGCSRGRTQCCDGTTSPSCTCYNNMPVG